MTQRRYVVNGMAYLERTTFVVCEDCHHWIGGRQDCYHFCHQPGTGVDIVEVELGMVN